MDDHKLRLAAFDWLDQQVEIRGDDVLPRSLLEKGFEFGSERIPLVSPQGIFKPKMLDIPLSITTAPKGPYDDHYNNEGFFSYRYRGTDINHRDNIGLREAMKANTPLIHFIGIVQGRYLAVWPVYIIGDDPSKLTFQVAVDDVSILEGTSLPFSRNDEDATARRAYLTSTIRVRLHQRSFRERVLHAYRDQCSLCRLRHAELLDAAHIIPDNEPDSTPTVDNGIALCKLHHAAFDSLILGIGPDYIIKVRADVLEEDDGPMLLHGLKELHSQRIILPASKDSWPNREFLERRFAKFNDAA